LGTAGTAFVTGGTWKRTALQLTWSLTPHPPAGNVPVFRTASASLHPLPSVGKTGGQDLLLSRTMLTNAVLTLEKRTPLQRCLTWVVSPATGIDLQPQTWRATHDAPYTQTPRGCRVLNTHTFLNLRSTQAFICWQHFCRGLYGAVNRRPGGVAANVSARTSVSGWCW
jgi:hypothetical protein